MTTKPLRHDGLGGLAEFTPLDILPAENIPATAGIPTHGDTAARTTLAASLGDQDTGRQFFDTDLDQLFVWVRNRWDAASIAPSSLLVRDYLGTAAEVLPLDYRKGDRWTDPSTPYCTLRVCTADPITHTVNDWFIIGRQG